LYWLSVSPAFFLTLVANHLIYLLFGVALAESVPVLQILLPGVVILTIYKVMTMDLAGRGKPWISMGAMFPPLIVNIVLNIILIPSLGANEAAIASTISYSTAGIVFLFLYCRETDQYWLDAIRPDFLELFASLMGQLKMKNRIKSPSNSR